MILEMRDGARIGVSHLTVIVDARANGSSDTYFRFTKPSCDSCGRQEGTETIQAEDVIAISNGWLMEREK